MWTLFRIFSPKVGGGCLELQKYGNREFVLSEICQFGKRWPWKTCGALQSQPCGAVRRGKIELLRNYQRVIGVENEPTGVCMSCSKKLVRGTPLRVIMSIWSHRQAAPFSRCPQISFIFQRRATNCILTAINWSQKVNSTRAVLSTSKFPMILHSLHPSIKASSGNVQALAGNWTKAQPVSPGLGHNLTSLSFPGAQSVTVKKNENLEFMP